MPRFLLAALLLLALAPAANAQRPPAAPSQNFSVVNRAAVPLRELYVTSGGNANWGQNRLDGKTNGAFSIAPGATFPIRRRADNACLFDFRAVFADGKTEDRRAVNVCAAEEVALGAGAAPTGLNPTTNKAADDPSFKLFNRSARPIAEFYAVLTGAGATPNWGANRLDTPLVPDSNRVISLPRDGNCIYDLRLVFADKRAQEKKHTNLCRISDLPVP